MSDGADAAGYQAVAGQSLGGGRLARARRLWEVVAHLAYRDVASTYRQTLLGWTWPLVRQAAQLAVLVFVFSVALDLGIEDYPVFVFCGLVAWSWFSSGTQDAAWSVISNRYLVFRSGFPVVVLPVVAVAVRFIDVLLALPVLVVMLVLAGEVHPTALLFPALAALQLVLMIAVGWIASAVSAYVRDVPNLVGVALLSLFYLTPVFYDVAQVPEKYQWILRLNPMAVLIEGYRDILLYGQLPDAAAMGAVLGVSLLLAAAGWLVFRRLAPDFVDVL